MSALVQAARNYLGVPFAHQGRAAFGMDCAGLLVLAEFDCGRVLRDVAAYGKTPWKDGLEAALVDNYGAPVTGPIVPGDKLLMRFRREPQHIAIATDYFLGGLGIIHTRSDLARGIQRGRVVEHRLDERWASYIVRVYR
jgi:cell wall-associated NlpC family hydrolase